MNYEAHYRAVNSALRSDTAAIPDSLGNLVRAAIGTGGKLLRSFICANAAAAVGGDFDQILPALLALEYGHTASLVHDDIVDQSEMRRGAPALWKQTSLAEALLTGDALVFRSVVKMTEVGAMAHSPALGLKAVETLAQAYIELAVGQVAEQARLGDVNITETECLKIAHAKTASLFGACAEIGAMVAGGTTQEISALQRYGGCLGMGFQLQDDLTCWLGSENQAAGKPKDQDYRDRTVTLPVVRALRNPLVSAELLRLLQGATPDDYEDAAALVRQSGAVGTVRSTADAYLGEALNALRVLPDSEAVSNLKSIPILLKSVLEGPNRVPDADRQHTASITQPVS